MENKSGFQTTTTSTSASYYTGKFVWYVVRMYFLISLAFIILYPLLYMLSMSLRSANDFLDVTVVWIPKTFTVSNYSRVLLEMELLNPMMHTTLLSVGATLLQIFVTSLAGYGFARFRFRFSGLLFALVIITIMMPSQMISIPNYLLMKNLDVFGLIGLITGKVSEISLLNNYLGIYLPALLGQGLYSGLFILIYRQFYRGLAVELEEAAMMDGCGFTRTYFSIMFPNAKTPLIICGTFSLVWYWGDFYTPYLILPNVRTLAVQLMDFNVILGKFLPLSEQNTFNKIPLNQAAAIVSILPLIILFLFTQRFFVKGIDKSGIVG